MHPRAQKATASRSATLEKAPPRRGAAALTHKRDGVARENRIIAYSALFRWPPAAATPPDNRLPFVRACTRVDATGGSRSSPTPAHSALVRGLLHDSRSGPNALYNPTHFCAPLWGSSPARFFARLSPPARSRKTSSLADVRTSECFRGLRAMLLRGACGYPTVFHAVFSLFNWRIKAKRLLLTAVVVLMYCFQQAGIFLFES